MGWHILESDGDWTGNTHRATYLLDAAGDIGTPPAENTQLAPGSIAYTADMANMWQKDGNGSWVKVGG